MDASQGSVAMHLRSGGIFNYYFAGNSLQLVDKRI